MTAGQAMAPRDQLLEQVALGCRDATGVHGQIGLTVWLADGQTTVTGTSADARGWDREQVEAGQGPLATARRSGQTTRTGDLGRDPRFPALTEMAPTGLSAVSCPLIVDGVAVGVLTGYDAAPHLLDDDDLVMPSMAAAASGIVECALLVISEGTAHQ